PLADVAERAGVSVQTVLRQFGSRAQLIRSTAEQVRSAVVEERRAPAGDVAAALTVLVDHYEQRGDWALLLLGQEESDVEVRAILADGKQAHREWVAEVFEPFVHGDPALVDLLVVVTDVYAWKLLRRDRGLSRDETQERIARMVRALLAAAEEG